VPLELRRNNPRSSLEEIDTSKIAVEELFS
jgi:hypothetical protein